MSPDTISKGVNCIAEEVLAWQRRWLESLYPVIYRGAIKVNVKVKDDDTHVVNKAAHIAIGAVMDSIRRTLGIWVQPHEGAKFRTQVRANLSNCGVRDVLIVSWST